MSNTSSSINSGPPSGPRSTEEQFRIVKKRNRVPVNCFPCRARKWKCDRNHPCGNCVKREGPNASSCIYSTSTTQNKPKGRGTLSPDDMQNRIGRLEDLIVTLMQGDANVDPGSGAAASALASARITNGTLQSSDVDQVTMQDDEVDGHVDGRLASSLGVLIIDLDKGKSVYIGQEHWHTILSEISEVKNYFSDHKKELQNSYEKIKMSKPASAREGLILLLGSVPPSTEVELRAELPPRSAVLALCHRYFNSLDNPVLILHSPTFHQQLEAHWQDPSQTPIMWMGLLYAVLSLAAQSHHNIGDEPREWQGRTLEMAAEYRLRTVQCLITADYTKPVEHTVETMLLYMFGEYASRWDADHGLWLLASLVTRVAFQMGYHRDAKWFPSLTPFQAEMRRRVWALLRMADVMFSHQVSLPNMIYTKDCDTQLPTNIFDDEFSPNSKTLPPSRPKHEYTRTAYTIAKVKLCIEMSNILQATNRADNSITYEEILDFDTRLRTIYEEIPAYLKGGPLGSSQDSAMVVLTRFSINSLYLNVLCLLHKKYVPRARKIPQYAYSRRSAVTAASETLGHLVTLYRETQPTGRLRSLKWYLNSMATKEFLVCAMLVALDLHHDHVAEDSSDGKVSDTAMFWTLEQRIEMLSNLEMTKEFWKGLAGSSTEAFQASKILEIMLDKIKSPSSAQEPVGSADGSSFSTFNTFRNIEPQHIASVTLGTLPVSITPNTAAAVNGSEAFSAFTATNSGSMASSMGVAPSFNARGDIAGYNSAPSPFSMFANLEAGGDIAANFDWTAFENYYTQTENWGDAGNFQIYHGPQNTDDSNMPFNSDNMTG